MIALVLALTRAELRAAPERAVAVAALLASAALLPRLLQVEPALRVLLAVGVAGAAAAGAAAQHRRRHEILHLNGAGPALDAGLAAASVVVPGAAAAAAAGLVEIATGRPAQVVAVVILTVVVPVLVAPLAPLIWSPRPPSRRRTVTLIAALVVLVPTVIVPLGALALLTGRRLTRTSAVGRTAGSIAAGGLAVGAAIAAGTSETWTDLWLVLTVAAVPLALAVGWIGSSALGITSWLLGRTGALPRLAVAALAERRAVLAPVGAIVALVSTLAVVEGVMGASFGAREAARDRVGAVLGTAGLQDHQAIVVTTVDLPAEEARHLAEGAADDAGVEVTLIDRLGTGGTEAAVSASHRPHPLGISLDVPPTWRLAGAPPTSPSWIGVAAPDDLPALGLARAADALARGDAVVLLDGIALDGQVQLQGPGGHHELPATVATPPTGPAVLLPAALISPERAAEIDQTRSGRAVFTPGVDPIDDVALAVVAAGFQDALRVLAPPVWEPSGMVGEENYLPSDPAHLVALEAARPIGLGLEPVRADPGGPLNALPYVSRSWEEGRSQALALGALALLVALAGTVLILGGSRADDAVLEAQGATRLGRAAMAAVQSAALTATAAVVAVTAGVGLPALGFRGYNARPRSDLATDIPLVVPTELLIGMAVLPLVAAALAGLATLLKPPRAATAFDDLAW